MNTILFSFFIVICITQLQCTFGEGENSRCGRARVRKSWDDSTPAERNLYIEAVHEAMKSDLHKKYIEIHYERASTVEAHETCGFMLWHRRYLLGWENLLRSLKPKFRCVFIPFWDTFSHFKKMADGACTSMENCSPIVTAFGVGSTRNSIRYGVYSGEIEGKCYVSNFKDVCDAQNSKCGCMPREDLSQVRIPSGSGISGIANQISSSRSFAQFVRSIQNSVHNEVHSAIGGYMRTMASPSDPLFFSWHATIDMLLYSYHQCKVGNNADVVSPFDFNGANEQCAYTSAAASVNKQSAMTMRMLNGQDVSRNADLGKYFSNLPAPYGHYVDSNKLGENSYTYRVPTPIRSLILMDNVRCPAYSNGGGNTGDSQEGSDSGESEEEDGSYWEWYRKTLAELRRLYPNNEAKVQEEMESRECLYYQEKFGVQNISEEFLKQQNLSTTLTRCGQVVEKDKNGTLNITNVTDVPSWKAKKQKGGKNVNTLPDSESHAESMYLSHGFLIFAFVFGLALLW